MGIKGRRFSGSKPVRIVRTYKYNTAYTTYASAVGLGTLVSMRHGGE